MSRKKRKESATNQENDAKTVNATRLLVQLHTNTALTTLGAQPHAPASGRSRPSEKNRGGGAEWRAGTGSPRKTFALARCKQHEMMPYHRQISAEGSRPKAAARAKASFL